ncbi:unnamed protein product [Scytosiphon promiscuus]
MSATRMIAATLISYLTIAYVGGNAQTLHPGDPSERQILFSVDVLVDESASPVPLGIREGQTAVQAAADFCREQGWSEATRNTTMPQLVKVLEDGMAEVVDAARPVSDEPAFPSSSMVDTLSKREAKRNPMLADPVLTLGISVGEDEERTLLYYAGQDPMDVAVAFCAESSRPEGLSTCSDTISAHIIESLGSPHSAPTREAETEQQQQLKEQTDARRYTGEKAATTVEDPLMTVPLNINGVETVLRVFRGSRAEDLADELCRREEHDLRGSEIDSCFSQIVEIVRRAVQAYERQDGQVQRQENQARPEPFTFKVPVTLAGLQLYADFRTDETPRASAERFCSPNLATIESALGIDLYEGEHEESGGEESLEERNFMSMGRESLREACTVVVEDAINAVLLGLRERVLEAEMAKRNATNSGDDLSARMPPKGEVAGEIWVAP